MISHWHLSHCHIHTRGIEWRSWSLLYQATFRQWSNVMWTPPFPTKNLSLGMIYVFETTWLLLLGKSYHSYFSTTALEAKVIVLSEVIKVTISNRMYVVLFEIDFKTLSLALATNNAPLNEFGDHISHVQVSYLIEITL